MEPRRTPHGAALLRLTLCGLALATSQAGFAREKVTVAARAEAVIVARLSLLKTDDLNFGRIVAGTSAGTVVLAPSGGRRVTGGTRLAAGTSNPAGFAGYGQNGQLVALSIAANSAQLTRSGGSEKMTIDTFLIGSTPVAQVTTNPTLFRINSATGMFAFPVGATLRVGARQVPGVYSGSFTVLIQYQ